ncbi:MAG: GyrI-like domain-containing protein [Thermoplasmata archaeon]|nr:GyrI-like domain-containing protein [Thermoplasmata archaeon]
MTVDFVFRKVPSYRVISYSWKGPWNDSRIRKEFENLAAWATSHQLRSSHWIFMEPGDKKWTVAVEVAGKVRGDRRVRVRTLPAGRVASVTFDPEVVSPRVVYHGLNDWLRWRRKDGDIRIVGASREVYPGNPWKDPKAWAHTEVQFTVKK